MTEESAKARDSAFKLAEESAAVVEASDEVIDDREDFAAERSVESEVTLSSPKITDPPSGGLMKRLPFLTRKWPLELP